MSPPRSKDSDGSDSDSSSDFFYDESTRRELKAPPPPRRAVSLLKHRENLKKKEERKRKIQRKLQREKEQATKQPNQKADKETLDSHPKTNQKASQCHQQLASTDDERSDSSNDSIKAKLQNNSKSRKVAKLKKASGGTESSSSYSEGSSSNSDFDIRRQPHKRRKSSKSNEKPKTKHTGTANSTNVDESLAPRAKKKPAGGTSPQTTNKLLPSNMETGFITSKQPSINKSTTTNETPICNDDDDGELGMSNQDQWTEVLAPGHVLAEEVRDYMAHHQSSLSEAETAHLNQWVSHVQTELEQQNQVVLKNIQLVKELREANRRRNRLQDELLKQRKQIQALKQEAAVYQSRVEQTNDNQSTMESANQFLLSLKQMKNHK